MIYSAPGIGSKGNKSRLVNTLDPCEISGISSLQVRGAAYVQTTTWVGSNCSFQENYKYIDVDIGKLVTYKTNSKRKNGYKVL